MKYLFFLFFLILVSCSQGNDLSHLERRFFRAAKSEKPKLAKKILKLSVTKEYPDKKIIFFNHFLSIKSKKQEDRIKYKESLSTLYFKKKLYYKSLKEHFFLLENGSRKKRLQYLFSIANIFFYLGKLDQSLFEIQKIKEVPRFSKEAPNFRYKVHDLHIKILVQQLNYLEAVKIYSFLRVNIKTLYTKKNLDIDLALVYEKLEKYSEMITALQRVKNHYPYPEFIERRIEQLREKIRLSPKVRRWRM